MKLPVLAVTLFLLLPGLAFTQTPVGTAYFSSVINWSQTPDLHFTVIGAPPNVCGDLVTTRNGSLLVSPGWICTDANGNAYANAGGTNSWSWANTPNDQTDTNVHYNWPNGTATYFTTNHYWDKTLPTPGIDSPSPFRRVPISFYGHGTDGYWGAGFSSSWTSVKLQFQDTNTGYYWNPSAQDYSAVSPPNIYATITSGLGTIGPGTNDSPSYYMTWDGTAVIPPVSSHQIGDSYTWTVTINDGDNRPPQPASISFTVQCGTFKNPC
jgi:hypothetical protein